MDDALTQDMTDAIEAVELDNKDRKVLRNILYGERTNKDREWNDDAIGYIISQLEASEMN